MTINKLSFLFVLTLLLFSCSSDDDSSAIDPISLPLTEGLFFKAKVDGQEVFFATNMSTDILTGGGEATISLGGDCEPNYRGSISKSEFNSTGESWAVHLMGLAAAYGDSNACFGGDFANFQEYFVEGVFPVAEFDYQAANEIVAGITYGDPVDSNGIGDFYSSYSRTQTPYPHNNSTFEVTNVTPLGAGAFGRSTVEVEGVFNNINLYDINDNIAYTLTDGSFRLEFQNP